MLKKLKLLLAAGAAAAAGAYATVQIQADKADVAVDKWRTEHLATFNPVCPHKRASVPVADYVRAWDRKAPFDAIVWSFAKNHGVTAEQAKACFIKPAE